MRPDLLDLAQLDALVEPHGSTHIPRTKTLPPFSRRIGRMTESMQEYEEIKSAVEALFAQHRNWVAFYREVFGRHGVIRRHCATIEARTQFEQTEIYQEILRMLTALRRMSTVPSTEEPTRVITIRIPKSMHEALWLESHERCTSMNKLCISKLLQFIDDEMVPGKVEEPAELRIADETSQEEDMPQEEGSGVDL